MRCITILRWGVRTRPDARKIRKGLFPSLYRRDVPPLRPSRLYRGAVLLPEGQHAGLHDRRDGLPRSPQEIRQGWRPGLRYLARFAEVARELQGEDEIPVRPAVGRGRESVRAVRRDEDEEPVWPQVP